MKLNHEPIITRITPLELVMMKSIINNYLNHELFSEFGRHLKLVCITTIVPGHTTRA